MILGGLYLVGVFMVECPCELGRKVYRENSSLWIMVV